MNYIESNTYNVGYRVEVNVENEKSRV